MTEIKRLNRFTTLPILLDYLEREKLVLLDPIRYWEDRNDTLVIEEYKIQSNKDKFFALCFSHKAETIHHWKSFADGSSGCCLEFDGEKMIKIFNGVKGVRHGIINYKSIKNTESQDFKLEEFPFIKRKPYEPESEYRVIYEGDTNEDVYEIDVPLECLNKIIFNQKMPFTIGKTIKSIIVDRYPILKGKVFYSTVYENKSWVKNFKQSNSENHV